MRTFLVTDVVRDYAVGHGSWVPDDVVRKLRSETQALGDVGGPVGAVVGGAIGAASGATAGALDDKRKDEEIVVTREEKSS